ncbi:HNH endonuclease signature motif containing protein [Streptomyces sp. NPDC096079]|uniref:HNH endonuclease signature motif containing protein n=1 Tax=unclassified Streptomyces TaxID=2593676 RepID=UPI003326D0A0
MPTTPLFLPPELPPALPSPRRRTRRSTRPRPQPPALPSVPRPDTPSPAVFGVSAAWKQFEPALTAFSRARQQRFSDGQAAALDEQRLGSARLATEKDQLTPRQLAAALRRLGIAEQRHQESRHRYEEADRRLAGSAQALQTAQQALTNPEEKEKAALLVLRAEQKPFSGAPLITPVGNTRENTPPEAAGVVAASTAKDIPLNHPDGRLCPVCGKGGLQPGQFRHRRCETAKLVQVEDTVEALPLSPAVVHEQQQRGRSSEYRRLVALAEQREPTMRGIRRKGSSTRARIEQSREAVLVRCGGLCENPGCAGQPADVKDDGSAILEVDHVQALEDGGPDLPWNMVALCPNCHRVKTYGSTRKELTRILAEVARHKHAAW